MNGDRIRSIRAQLGLSQAELARLLYLEGDSGPRLVRAWENDEKPISGPARKVLELLNAKERT